ncbi:MMPL family transporter [candidate division KSB1 bacterium]|nr:MMPL family transporter [candidate division KSB1 bacterium]
MKFFYKIPDFLTEISYRYPFTVVLIAFLLAAAGGYIYFFKLPIISDRDQLVSKALETNRIYQEYRDEFGGEQVLVLVAKTKDTRAIPTPEQRKQMKLLAKHWAQQLRLRPELFPNVWERIESADWNSLALLYLQLENLQKLGEVLNEHLPKFEEWAHSPSLSKVFAILNQEFKNIGTDTATTNRERISIVLSGLTDFLRWLQKELTDEQSVATNGSNSDFYSFLSQGRFDPDGFIFSRDGRLLTAFATVSANSGQQNRYAEVMEFAEAALKNALAEIPESLGLEAGLAGMPALEYEELKTAHQDFSRSAVIALFCVTLLFVLAFRNFIRPALAAACLCLAIAITFGVVWLTIGHLNLLAMIFTVILVALGIDFAIHFVTHYEHALAEGDTPAQAIKVTYSSIGGALWMGGITTATAFLSACFTEFAGLAELGIIAGSGLIICLICMVVVYPAMLFLLDTRQELLKTKKNIFFNPIGIIISRLNFKTARWIAVVSVLLLGLGYFFGQYTFDTNLLNLQAMDSQANRWQRILLSTGDRSLFAICTFKDRNSLERMQNIFDDSPGWVEATESLYPSNELEKREILASLCEQVGAIKIEQPGLHSTVAFKRQIWNFRQTIRKYRNANLEAKTALADLENELSSLYRTINILPPEKLKLKLTTLENKVSLDFKDRLPELQSFFCPPPLSIDRLPESLKSRFLGKNGSLALFIYPAKNVWEQANLAEFVQKARGIEPNIAGELVSLYENGQSIIRSFLQASGYSLAAILVLLLIWSRSVRSTLLSLLPLITSVGLLLGIMTWYRIHWNFTNFFALPILIGIGVDSGIHLVKAWQDKNPQTFQRAGKAVFLSSMTTIVGFGILATSDHLGVRSLGLVLFLGISFCLLASLVFLPAALKLFMKKD